MATYNEASAKRDAIFSFFASDFHLRPRAIGIFPIGNHQYAVKVTLPRRPEVELPSEVYGIPVRYDLSEEAAVLAGQTRLKWYEKAATRK